MDLIVCDKFKRATYQPRVELVCSVCGKHFTMMPSEYRKYEKKGKGNIRCSRACYVKDRKEKELEKKKGITNRKKRVPCTCPVCLEPFTIAHSVWLQYQRKGYAPCDSRICGRLYAKRRKAGGK